MSLILAILLGLFLFIRITSEKQSTKAARMEYDKHHAEYVERSARFRALHQDLELEHSVKTNVELCEEVRNLIRRNTGIVRPPFEMVQMIAMAKFGKIPSEYISEWPMRIGLYMKGDFIEREQQSKKFMDFLRFYNQLLRSHGVDEDLVFLTYQSDAKNERCEPVSVQEYDGQTLYLATWKSVNWSTSPFGSYSYANGLDVLRWE